MRKIKLTKIDIKRKLGTAKKKLFPIVWGCSGEMPMRQFRHIIISMWMLLAVSLTLGSVNAALIPFGGDFVGIYLRVAYFAVPTFASIILGAVVCGLGTSIFSALDQNSVNMTVRKALFCMMTIVFLFTTLINIAFAFILVVFTQDIPIIIINVLSFIVQIVMFVLAFVTLVKQTCCIWNKNDREYMILNGQLESASKDETDSSGQGINEEKIQI
ncbi:unnamed protein product [Oikopleura dioica]|uniref:Uncharacterized protein n=1 Tax=Oikopleura dioica TaxID=34765 RepID=E4XL50_OIKDI|nr:unnamed protein product [Oikopleura dioica]